jgi:NAD/NADP transhydrogenase beta subunit
MDALLLIVLAAIGVAYAVFIAITGDRMPRVLRFAPSAGLIGIGFGVTLGNDVAIVAGLVVAGAGLFAHIFYERVLGGASRGTGRHS